MKFKMGQVFKHSITDELYEIGDMQGDKIYLYEYQTRIYRHSFRTETLKNNDCFRFRVKETFANFKNKTKG